MQHVRGSRGTLGCSVSCLTVGVCGGGTHLLSWGFFVGSRLGYWNGGTCMLGTDGERFCLRVECQIQCPLHRVESQKFT
jgi:hypothetical protein